MRSCASKRRRAEAVVIEGVAQLDAAHSQSARSFEVDLAIVTGGRYVSAARDDAEAVVGRAALIEWQEHAAPSVSASDKRSRSRRGSDRCPGPRSTRTRHSCFGRHSSARSKHEHAATVHAGDHGHRVRSSRAADHLVCLLDDRPPAVT